MATAYNFAESLNRIETILSSKVPEKPGGAIPSADGIESSTVYLPQATVVHVNYEIVLDQWRPVEKKHSLPVIQSFISETINIGGACTCCRDIMIADNSIRLIYDTPLKTELNEALDDAARIRTLAMVISKKANAHSYPTIKTSIGMDYGTVAMLPVNFHDRRFQSFMWMGEAIDNAKQYADSANEEIVISPIVWNNLTENNRKLFTTDGIAFTSNYRGKIVNVAMNNWITK